MAISTTYGNIYHSSYFEQSFPSGLFLYPPEYTNITCNNGWIIIPGATGATADETASFAVANGSKGNVSQVNISFHVIGHWKAQ